MNWIQKATHRIRLNILILVLVCSLPKIGLSIPNQEPLEILFIGNSHTSYNDLPGIFKNLAVSGNKDVYIESYLVGGRSLYQHAIDSLTNRKIQSKRWDYIILQGTGRNIAYPASFPAHPVNTALSILEENIHQHCPSTRIVLLLIWADEDGMTWYYDWKETYQVMQDDIYYNTINYAKNYNLTISPVGWAWKKVLAEKFYPLHYLHRNDWSHPSLKGSFLAACVIYSSVFIERTEGLDYNASLEISESEYFKAQASATVLNELEKWNITMYNDTTFGEITAVDSEIIKDNQKVVLTQNYPNPFSNETTINYTINEKTVVEIALYNLLGNRISTLLLQEMVPGEYSLKYNRNSLKNGVYIYSIKTSSYSEMKKMQIID